MKVMHYEQIASAAVNMDGATNCRMRCLIGPDDNAPSFSMRQFELGPGGQTPRHAHGHEHEIFVLEGAGVVAAGDKEYPLKPGSIAFVPPNQVHQFRNTGSTAFKFLCLIPHPMRGMSGPCIAACGCDG